MIVDSALYRRGVRVEVDCATSQLHQLQERASEPDDFVWVGLHEPSHDELSEVAEVFGLHALAVEDAVRAHQRPKLERYADSIFLTLKTLWYVDADDAVETGEINMFVGRRFVVTVRHGEGGELHDARLALENEEQVLAHGPSAVVYAVCDRVVDGYEAVLSALEDDVEEVEASVFSPARTDDSTRIYVLKREIAEVRRAVLPLRDPIRRFADAAAFGIDPKAAPFFRDVSDHLARAAENLDTLDGMLSTAFDGHMARISIQQNDDMRKISAGAAIVVVPTLIAGIYGMNLKMVPAPSSVIGFPFALGLMLVTGISLWVWFRKSGWL